MKLVHYDLFAGIGGFSLALDTIFHEQKNEHIFCEWEEFPTAILKKHWPDGTYYGDIADLIADTNDTRSRTPENEDNQNGTQSDIERKGQSLHRTGRHDSVILTGGFPCQPFSQAGRRAGTSDDRYKWPDMFSVIRNVRPDWIIAENVRGLVTWNDGMVLETVCADLESEGYEVQPFIIPAVAIGAPHRRDRVWIIANTLNGRQRREEQGSPQPQDSLPQEHRKEDSTPREFERADSNREAIQLTPNPRQQHGQSGNSERVEANQTIGTTSSTHHERQGKYDWSTDWREVALATCHDGVDDGLSRKLDGATLRGKVVNEISANQHRKERLKACGNAIVPQVAMEIFKAIKNI